MTSLNPWFTEDEREYLAEREAIAEYDAGLSRKEAELWAYKCYVNKYFPESNYHYEFDKATRGPRPD